MNDPLVEMLSCVADVRREQAKRYSLANILLFCIFGFLCGAKSYKRCPARRAAHHLEGENGSGVERRTALPTSGPGPPM